VHLLVNVKLLYQDARCNDKIGCGSLRIGCCGRHAHLGLIETS